MAKVIHVVYQYDFYSNLKTFGLEHTTTVTDFMNGSYTYA